MPSTDSVRLVGTHVRFKTAAPRPMFVEADHSKAVDVSHPTCHACGFIIERDAVSCPFCGRDPNVAPEEGALDGAGPLPPMPFDMAGNGVAFHGSPLRVEEPDGWFGHFLRFAGAAVLVSLSHVLIVGFVWTAAILNRTGYRRRDVFLTLVPVLGSVLFVITMWRYTAKTPYWSVRPDLPGRPMSTMMRPTVVAGGWIALAGFVVLAVVGERVETPQEVAQRRALEYVAGDGDREFVASDSEFRATFPHVPGRFQEPLDPAFPAETITIYTAETLNQGFSVSTFDIAPDAPFDLDLAANGAAAGLEGRLETADRTSIQGFDAVEYVVAVRGGLYVKALVTRTPTRVYQLQVGGLTNPPAGYDQFLQSFEITASPMTAPA